MFVVQWKIKHVYAILVGCLLKAMLCVGSMSSDYTVVQAYGCIE